MTFRFTFSELILSRPKGFQFTHISMTHLIANLWAIFSYNIILDNQNQD